MCKISSAKRTSQKIEFRPVEEEKQEDVVLVGVPESEPVEQFREKPGIAVGGSDSLSLSLRCLFYPFHELRPLS